jgi:hypothetical protein
MGAMRRGLVMAGLLGAVVAVSMAIGADGKTTQRPRLAVKVIDGPDMTVGPLQVTEVGAYDLKCPRGYLVSGVGTLQGATDVVYATPNPDDRTASFSFANPDDSVTFHAAGTIVCVRGERGLRARAAVASDERVRAVRDAVRRLHG